MHIKSVKEYYVSYCELVVTDNLRNVVCICDSLDSGMVPKEYMGIKKLNAFFVAFFAFCFAIPFIRGA